MQIDPKEVAGIEEAGMLDGHPVKLVRLKGGFFIAVGKPRGKSKEEALAAGSHGAIVKFNIEKSYPDFQPVMMKSEGMHPAVAESHSHFLSEDLRKSGHDIFSVKEGETVNFYITKHNMNVHVIESVLEKGELAVSLVKIDPSFVPALSGAVSEKALALGIGKVKVG